MPQVAVPHQLPRFHGTHGKTNGVFHKVECLIMQEPSPVEKSLAVHPNVDGTRAGQGGDASHEFGSGGRTSVARYRPPKVEPPGSNLVKSEGTLRGSKRHGLKHPSGPCDPKGSQGPTVIGGGLDPAIRVDIGVVRGARIGPTGGR